MRDFLSDWSDRMDSNHLYRNGWIAFGGFMAGLVLTIGAFWFLIQEMIVPVAVWFVFAGWPWILAQNQPVWVWVLTVGTFLLGVTFVSNIPGYRKRRAERIARALMRVGKVGE